ncbi:hypothetical protein OUZ56_025035 [Daphnia magna]|uniref:Secreted protein n=1 Tax=Daphnia magna TaxID=35525 RepID=A0ABQ9ZIN2_9CRUS|nr:hypothetical protein OUZ56_025035 [Daphnia magna]
MLINLIFINFAVTFTCWAVLYDNIPQLRVINKGQQAYTETNTTLSHTQQVPTSIVNCIP